MSENRKKLLIADDEINTRMALERYYRHRFDVTTAMDGLAAIEELERQRFDLVITDLRMPGADGMEVTRAAGRQGVPVIMLTAYGSIEDAVKAVKLGAFDFVPKPIKLDALEQVMESALGGGRGNAGVVAGKTREKRKAASPAKTSADGFVIPGDGGDPMSSVYETAKTVAASRASVLLYGESGTGKEVVAKLIHDESGRRGPFVPVHCAALTSTLLESELFGHEKGAFTGAVDRKIGKFEHASGGTVFLDEIGEIDQQTQVKLLRVLETRSFERVGGTDTITSDFRLIAATNRDLRKMVADGAFREDLFYRISVINLELPPLRERGSVIDELIGHFIGKYAEENGKPVPAMDDDVRSMLLDYRWPGNIRELKNCVESMVVLSRDGRITMREVPAAIRNGGSAPAEKESAASEEPSRGQELDLRKSEYELIEKALAECNGNRTHAAQKLGISRRTLIRRLAEMKES